MAPILSFQHVSCSKGKNDSETKVIRNLSFSVEQGEIVTLVGASGAGKSTVLRLIIGLDEKKEGDIFFQDKKIENWKIVELRRKIGFVAQLPYLFAGTVRENLLYAPAIHKTLPKDESAFVKFLLDQVGLSDLYAHRKHSDLSVGQQMRVSLARTLANNPVMLLLDEPTASLDPSTSSQILQLILDLSLNQGFTVLAVTHDLQSARTLHGRCLFLHQGCIEEEGPVERLLSEPHSPVLKNFVEGKLS